MDTVKSTLNHKVEKILLNNFLIRRRLIGQYFSGRFGRAKIDFLPITWQNIYSHSLSVIGISIDLIFVQMHKMS